MGQTPGTASSLGLVGLGSPLLNARDAVESGPGATLPCTPLGLPLGTEKP